METVVICTGHLGGQIETAVSDGASFGLSVLYSDEGGKLLGTGGALKRALPFLGPEFFVLYGDSYLTCSFAAVQAAYRAAGAPALMTVFRNEGKWDVSNAVFGAERRLVYDKKAPSPEMTHIDYGLGILSSAALEKCADGQVVDLADVYRDLSLDGRLAGFEAPERFYEIGSRQGIADAEKFLSSRRVES